MTDEDPICDKCGAPIDTGAIAAICPHGKECEFYPDDADSQAFVEQLREGFARVKP